MLYFVEERRAIMLSLFTRGTGLFLVLLVLFNTCIVLAKVWPEGNSEDIFHNRLVTFFLRTLPLDRIIIDNLKGYIHDSQPVPSRPLSE